MTQSLSKTKRFVFASVLILSSLAFSLTAGEVILRYRRHYIEDSNRIDSGLIVYDALLGWKLTKNWRGNHRHYDFDVQYSINEDGFRGKFEKKQSESERIYAFVGDSFTFSYGVNERETFVDLLNQIKKREGIIFYNFGVPGYSTDQESLLIKERVFTFDPDIIFLVVYLHNDLIDNEYPFPMQAHQGKPYFEITSSGLQLKNTPVPLKTKSPEQHRLDLGRLSRGAFQPTKGVLFRNINRFELTRWMAPFFKKSPHLNEQFKSRLSKTFRLFYAIVDDIQEECRKQNVALRLVLMPGKSFVERPKSPSAYLQNYMREQVIEESDARNLSILDLAGHLRNFHAREGLKLFHPNEGHLNSDGHRVAANYFAAQLQK
jgi:hypothetical protein